MQALVFTLCIALAAAPALAQDVVIFRNGDRLSGKIQRMEQGKVVFDAPALDGVTRIDWNRIVRIESERLFQFQTQAGENFMGRISPEAEMKGTFTVDTEGRTREIKQDDIVFVTQTVEGIGGLLEATAGAGFTLTRSNNQQQTNAEAKVRYESTSYVLSGSVSSLFTSQKNADDTSRHAVNIGFRKKLQGRWGLGGLNNYLTSTQQKLLLRVTLGGGPAYDLIRNNRMILRVLGGAVWNNERYNPEFGAESGNEIEALGGAEFAFFQFRQWDLDTGIHVFPSVSVAGRVRADWRTTFRVRLIRGRKLWWNISGTLNLDNKPPALAPGNDYYATTSISYAFP